MRHTVGVLKKTRKRKQKGGAHEIDLRQILLTEPIMDAIVRYNPDADISQYKMSKGPSGFRLSRMEQMMQANRDALEPIDLKKATSATGRPLGTKIDGTLKPLYEIINGRHRVARAIIESRRTIKHA